MRTSRFYPPIELAVVASALAGAAIAVAVRVAAPAEGLSTLDALGAAGLGLLMAAAALAPRLGLALSLAYVASPLSFYILFRGTDLASPYPASSDLAIDAAVTLGLAGAALAGAVARSWGSGGPVLPPLPARRPLAAIAAVLAVTGAVGVVSGNPLKFVLSDVVPFAELGVLAWVTLAVVDTREKALLLVRVVALSLAVTALVRLVLYAQGPGAFGVQPVTLEGSARPRLYQAYPYGWLLPFALACALAAQRRLDRVCALGMTLLCGLMVLLSFERGLWVSTAVGTLAVVAFGLRRRPRVMAPVLGTAAVALVLGGGLLGGGSGFTDPVSLVRDRLAGTSDQLAHREGLSHKRQDEATLLWRRIRDDRISWPLGHGLGAEYVGPTGIREGEYAQSFREKHYSFNWYLATAFRTGFAGLAVALWLVLALAAFGVGVFRRGGTLLERGCGLSFAGGIAGLALIAPINPYLLAHPLASIQGATLALLAFVARPRGARPDTEREEPPETRAAPVARGAPPPRSVAEVSVPGARWLLAGASAAAAGLVLALTRGFTFHGDEWLVLLTRRDWTPDVLLDPHRESWSTIPILLYKVLLEVAGAEAYWPYLLLAAVAHVGLACVLFLLVRRRAGDVLALAAAAIVLFLGRGAENLTSGFQAGFVGALALGLAAALLLDRPAPGRRRAVAASVALVLALMCGDPGVVVVAALAAELLADRRRRRLLLVLLPPVAAYAAWYLLYGRHGHDVEGLSALADGAAGLPGYVWLGLRAAAAAAIGAPVGLGFAPLLALAGLVTAAAVRRRGLTPRAIGATTGLFAVFLLAGLFRAGGGGADQQRYRYAGAVFVLLLAAETLRELPWRGRWRAAVAVGAVVAVTWNIASLVAFSDARGELLDAQTAELQALTTLRGSADMYLDAPIDREVLPREVTPREYFAATAALGSPVPGAGAAGLDALPPAAVDRALVDAFGPSTRVFRVRRFRRSRDCERRLRATRDFVVPAGSLLVVRSPARRVTTLFLWRGFGPDVDVSGELPFIAGRARLPAVRDVPLAAARPVAARLPDLGRGLTWNVRWAGLPAASDLCLARTR